MKDRHFKIFIDFYINNSQINLDRSIDRSIHREMEGFFYFLVFCLYVSHLLLFINAQ